MKNKVLIIDDNIPVHIIKQLDIPLVPVLTLKAENHGVKLPYALDKLNPEQWYLRNRKRKH